MDIARYAWNDNFAEPDVESGSDDGKFRGEGSGRGTASVLASAITLRRSSAAMPLNARRRIALIKVLG